MNSFTCKINHGRRARTRHLPINHIFLWHFYYAHTSIHANTSENVVKTQLNGIHSPLCDTATAAAIKLLCVKYARISHMCEHRIHLLPFAHHPIEFELCLPSINVLPSFVHHFRLKSLLLACGG